MSIIAEFVNDARFNLRFRKQFKKWQTDHDRKAPRAGDMAPDFTLSDVTGNESVTLSDFRGKKPVVLVFGSYT